MEHSTTIFTYDDYLTLPNDGKRYEIIDGDLFMTPAPSTQHQEILGNIFSLLRSHAAQHASGKVYCSPVDVIFSMTEIVQPDIVYVRKERLQIVAEKNIVGAPDLVVEILSDTTSKTDRTTKKNLYERNGVKEYWIVDPDEKKVEVYLSQQNSLTHAGTFTLEQKLESGVLQGLSVIVKEVFAT